MVFLSDKYNYCYVVSHWRGYCLTCGCLWCFRGLWMCGAEKGNMKHLHVTCAIIEKGGFVLAAQRSEDMSLPLKWEFPGGKSDTGESQVECLRREIFEEMGIHIRVEKNYHLLLTTISHSQ